MGVLMRESLSSRGAGVLQARPWFLPALMFWAVSVVVVLVLVSVVERAAGDVLARVLMAVSS